MLGFKVTTGNWDGMISGTYATVTKDGKEVYSNYPPLAVLRAYIWIFTHFWK